MNEKKQAPSASKENTIDILVNPKQKEERDKAEAAAEKKTASPKASPAAKPSGKATVTKASTTDRTRAVPGATAGSVTTTEQIAQKTRVGGTTAKKKPVSTPAPVPHPTKKEKKASKKPSAEEKKELRSSFVPTLFIALFYIGFVVFVSALLSYFGIRWANDVFALAKEEVTAVVTIPENAQLQEVADILKENGLIEYPSIFRLYINFKNRDLDPPLAFKAGEYELKSTLNYDQIVSVIKDRKSRSIVKITIPEGFTIDEIINLFTSQGIGTREGFVEAINNFPYEYTFMEKLKAIELSPNRKYRLEGYLFPDTYEFYTDSSEVAIVDKMLVAFESHMENAYYARMDELGMNLDQVITLASIVQKEGKFNADFYPIAGVFHNRLKMNNYLKRLQSDATVQYCLAERKEELTYADLEIENPYNTYRNEGLPPSAIANPGWEAIQATLYPESHSYYFFVSDTDGSTVFAKNEPEHQKNVEALRKAKENGTTID